MTERSRSQSSPGRSGWIGAHTVAFTVVAIFHLLRLRADLPAPSFIAEDGYNLLLTALCPDQEPVTAPIVGSPVVLERWFTRSAFRLFPELLPHLLLLTSIVGSAYALTYSARRGFAWLLPDERTRVVVAILIGCGAGTYEVIGSLIGLTYVFPWLAAMVSLERRERLTGGAIVAALNPLASPIGLAFVPVGLAGRWISRSPGGLLVAASLALSAVLPACAYLGAPVEPQSTLAGRDRAVLMAIDFTLAQGLAVPLFGTGVTSRLLAEPVWYLFVVTVLAAGFAAMLLRRSVPRERRIAVLSMFGSVVVYGAIRFSARSYAAAPLADGAVSWFGREAFFGSAAFLLGACALLSPPGEEERTRPAAPVAAILLLVLVHLGIETGNPAPLGWRGSLPEWGAWVGDLRRAEAAVHDEPIVLAPIRYGEVRPGTPWGELQVTVLPGGARRCARRSPLAVLYGEVDEPFR
jgi:hypothetical protein